MLLRTPRVATHSRVLWLWRSIGVLALACVIALTGPACAEDAAKSAVENPDRPAFHLDDASVPDPVRTPGEADKSIKADTICESEGQPLPPSAALCEGAFADFRIPEERRYQYECVFIISPMIGGARTRKNVWLQPGQEAALKQALDRGLRTRVCGKEISLKQAQNEVAEDWTAAYRRYLTGDVAVVTYDTPVGEKPREVPTANASNGLPDKRLMSADVSQPQATGAPPIEASVALGSDQSGSGQSRAQPGNQRRPNQAGFNRGGPNSRPGRPLSGPSPAIGARHPLPRQAGR